MELSRVIRVALVAAAIGSLAPGAAAFAGTFRVSPIRMELGKNIKSGTISVSNDGEARMNFQMSVAEWSQDEAGKDVYKDTTDIVFFPKIMSLDPGEQRVIRLGMKGSPPATERTYRMFISELPAPRSDSGEGRKVAASVSISFRFAPPIFIKPVKEVRQGIIDRLDVKKSIVQATVRNAGNVHFRIEAVTVRARGIDGGEVFSRPIEGWYLLSGASRPYQVEIPAELCEKASTIDVEVKAEQMTFNRTVNVIKEMCK